MTTALLDTLRQIVGAAHVLTHEDPAADLTAWEQDWRKRVHGKALAVVRPASTNEVAAVVKACAASQLPGGGSLQARTTPSVKYSHTSRLTQR